MKNPLVIDDTKRLSGGRRAAYSFVTLIAWGLWCYLWLPLVSLLAWLAGVRVFVEHMAIPEHEHYLMSLAWYGAVVATLALVIVGWSRYNLRRFGGEDRRRGSPPVTRAELARSFEIDLTTVAALQKARNATLDLGDDGSFGDLVSNDADDGDGPRHDAPTGEPLVSSVR